MDAKLSLLDTVVATVALPDQHVLAGDLGTIVEIHTEPSIAYEVKFTNPDGSTRALLTLLPSQLRRLTNNDVITTRLLQAHNKPARFYRWEERWEDGSEHK